VKAERVARLTADTEISEEFLTLAKKPRSQADVLKAKKLKANKKRTKKRRWSWPPDPTQVYFHEADIVLRLLKQFLAAA
jgi:hypothetical protein